VSERYANCTLAIYIFPFGYFYEFEPLSAFLPNFFFIYVISFRRGQRDLTLTDAGS
jgi:F0F1-type ATP synthase assembly protein I